MGLPLLKWPVNPDLVDTEKAVRIKAAYCSADALRQSIRVARGTARQLTGVLRSLPQANRQARILTLDRLHVARVVCRQAAQALRIQQHRSVA